MSYTVTAEALALGRELVDLRDGNRSQLRNSIPTDHARGQLSLLPITNVFDKTHSIASILARFGEDALRFALHHNIRVVPLRRSERYVNASPALVRLEVHVDRWPSPPAGLFVVEERTVYLRSHSPMTVAHEFGHALDCALGGGIYRSGLDHRVRSFFSSAREFITPYAATGLDEYMAEAIRAWTEINDAASLWPRATRDRLWRIDQPMFLYVEHIFRTAFKLNTPQRNLRAVAP